MTAMNKLEQMVLDMVKAGKPIHGMARDIWIDMTLREKEKETEAE